MYSASKRVRLLYTDHLSLLYFCTEGYYTLNSIDNGKQNWIQVQGSNAIWYDKDSWNIGDKEHLGTSNCSLYSTKNTKRPEEATTWKYFTKDGEWMSTYNIFGPSSMY